MTPNRLVLDTQRTGVAALQELGEIRKDGGGVSGHFESLQGSSEFGSSKHKGPRDRVPCGTGRPEAALSGRGLLRQEPRGLMALSR
jgi:hypothetical protein